MKNYLTLALILSAFSFSSYGVKMNNHQKQLAESILNDIDTGLSFLRPNNMGAGIRAGDIPNARAYISELKKEEDFQEVLKAIKTIIEKGIYNENYSKEIKDTSNREYNRQIDQAKQKYKRLLSTNLYFSDDEFKGLMKYSEDVNKNKKSLDKKLDNLLEKEELNKKPSVNNRKNLFASSSTDNMLLSQDAFDFDNQSDTTENSEHDMKNEKPQEEKKDAKNKLSLKKNIEAERKARDAQRRQQRKFQRKIERVTR